MSGSGHNTCIFAFRSPLDRWGGGGGFSKLKIAALYRVSRVFGGLMRACRGRFRV